ncbi:MAG: hypothetical protein NVS9B2_23530 [Steroidobacteraceae bacterium]
MGALTNILGTKELTPIAYQPLLLAAFQFIDGSSLFLSTHPLNPTEGGPAYLANNYLARIDRQDIAAIAARSEQGVDRISAVTLHIHDSDRLILSNYEFDPNRGFKGAVLTLTLVFSDLVASFSSDAWNPFVGVCDGPRYERQARGDMLIVTANASRNMARTRMPNFHVQQRCANLFPRNQAERKDGAGNMSSKNWGCGYSPDVAVTDPETGGSAQVGNGLFTTCNLTKADCMVRLGNGTTLDKDSAGRQTGRFTGDTWAPGEREIRSRSYVDGETHSITQIRNDAAYSQVYPMIAGTQWVKPVILSVPADANSTRMEAVLCQDKVENDKSLNSFGPNQGDAIIQVVCNGIIVPHSSSTPDKNLFRWDWSSNGSRRGVSTGDVPWLHTGDPHGSLACIEIVVYNEIAQGGIVPDVRVLMRGPQCKIATSADDQGQSNWINAYTTNPVWRVLDALIWGNYTYSQCDIQSFIDEAPFCDALVTYTDLNGKQKQHPRFKCQYAIETSRTGADVLQSILRSFNAQTTRNAQTGKLRILIRKSLADQQPKPIPGSNYDVGIGSITATGGGGTGYVAYHFDESNITRSNADDPPFLRMYTDASSQTPNRITFSFQDEDNSFAHDSISVVDPDAIARAGGYDVNGTGEQEVIEQLNVLGVSSFDQAIRISNVSMAERLRGNPTADSRGTIYVDIPCSFRAVHLQTGQIIAVTWTQYNWARKLFRIINIAPSTDWETAVITAAWHDDSWYTDLFGQVGAPRISDPRKHRRLGSPYAWQPFGAPPIAGDSVYGTVPGYADRSWWGMGAAQAYEILADGSALAKVSIFGCPPVNVFTNVTKPPLLGPVGDSQAFGGAIQAGRQFFGAVSAQAGGVQTPLSHLFKVFTPGAAGVDGSTCSITTPSISWFAGADSWVIYLGTDENNLSNQGAGTGTPAVITLTGLNYETYGPPDELADTLHFLAKRAGGNTDGSGHAGVWGDAVVTVAANTLSFAAAFTPNQWVGYDIMMVAGAIGDITQIPIANYRVTANSATDLTVTPDPLIVGILPGSVFVMLSLPSSASTTTKIVDPNWQNFYAPGGMLPKVEIGSNVRILQGPGIYSVRVITANDATSVSWDDPLPFPPDATTRYIIEAPAWDYDVDIETVSAAAAFVIPAPLVAKIAVDNYKGQTIFLQANVKDAEGNDSIYAFAPYRILYIWGNPGNAADDSQIWVLNKGKVTY